ncbi:MAG: AraC family transcriptional regulator [Lachnospiraceae bacterium]
MSYYQKKTERNEARFGVFCYVNNLPRPWYKRFSSGEAQKASTVYITDQFLECTGAVFTDFLWNRTAHAVNNREVSLPLLADICREIKSADMSREAFSLFFQGKALEAAGLLIDYTLSFDLESLPTPTLKAKNAAKSALQTLNQSFAQPPVIDDLAKSIGINKQTLQRAFQQLTGQTIHEYIKAIRMEKSISLLTDTPKRIDEIAKEVGYQSKGNFFKAFAETFGCTPNEMRRAQLSK